MSPCPAPLEHASPLPPGRLSLGISRCVLGSSFLLTCHASVWLSRPVHGPCETPSKYGVRLLGIRSLPIQKTILFKLFTFAFTSLSLSRIKSHAIE